MRARRQWVLWLAVAAVMAAATGSRAQSTKGSDTLYQDEGTKLEKSNSVWSQNDACGKDSFRKFPDFTPEAATSRDVFMRDCLRKHHLPPRNDVAQPLRPAQ